MVRWVAAILVVMVARWVAAAAAKVEKEGRKERKEGWKANEGRKEGR